MNANRGQIRRYVTSEQFLTEFINNVNQKQARETRETIMHYHGADWLQEWECRFLS